MRNGSLVDKVFISENIDSPAVYTQMVSDYLKDRPTGKEEY